MNSRGPRYCDTVALVYRCGLWVEVSNDRWREGTSYRRWVPSCSGLYIRTKQWATIFIVATDRKIGDSPRRKSTNCKGVLARRQMSNECQIVEYLYFCGRITGYYPGKKYLGTALLESVKEKGGLPSALLQSPLTCGENLNFNSIAHP